MGWKDWDRTNKVVVAACGVVVLAVIVTFAVLALGPKGEQSPPPSGNSTNAQSSDSPSPSPTFQCTTATGPDCTKDLADKEKARDAAYAEAEQNYLKVEKAIDKAYQQGGIAIDGGLPPDVVKYVHPELRRTIAQELKDFYEVGWYMSGTTRIESGLAENNPTWPTSSILLVSCLDTSQVSTLKKDGDEFVESGSFALSRPEMRLIDGEWILYEFNFDKESTSCAG